MDPSGFATAYALSTSIGLRPFLTLAFASLAMHLGYLHPSPAFSYLGSDGATWLLFGLAAVEFVGDKVPAVDHTLHVLHFATKPIAAALLVGSALPSGGAPDATSYALMSLGALNALGVHSGVAALRAGSTATTLGVANPFLSLIEDVLAICATVLALIAPFAGALLALLLTVFVLFALRYVFVTLQKRNRATVRVP